MFVDKELMVKVAEEAKMPLSEFADFLDDCNNGRGSEWKEYIVNSVSDDIFRKWMEETEQPVKRIYQISMDIELEEGTDIAEFIKAMEEDFLDPLSGEKIVGWTQETSWTEKEYQDQLYGKN